MKNHIPINEEFKACIKCGLKLKLDDFYMKTETRWDTTCKECRKKSRKSNYQKNKKAHDGKTITESNTLYQNTNATQKSPQVLDDFENIADVFRLLKKGRSLHSETNEAG